MKPSFRTLARNWWPAVVWLGIIRLESTDTASSSNTWNLLYYVVSFVFPKVSPHFVSEANAILRTIGHFMGYGILGALVFFALKHTRRDWLRPHLRRPWGTYLRDLWRAEWAIIGMLVTIVTASFDEIHQSFLPSRTGQWQDVVLDACGAAVLQILIYLLALRTFNRKRAPVAQPEFSSR